MAQLKDDFPLLAELDDIRAAQPELERQIREQAFSEGDLYFSFLPWNGVGELEYKDGADLARVVKDAEEFCKKVPLMCGLKPAKIELVWQDSKVVRAAVLYKPAKA